MITIYKRVAALKRESSAPFVNLVQGEHSSRERISLPWVCACVWLSADGGAFVTILCKYTSVHAHTCLLACVCPLFVCALAAAERLASRGVNVEV